MEHGVHVLLDVEWEHRQDPVLVSPVMHVVHHALDHLPKQDLVVQQSLTPNGVVMEHGVHVLYNVELEYRRGNDLVTRVILVDCHVLDHQLKHDLVEEHQLTPNGESMEHGVRVL